MSSVSVVRRCLASARTSVQLRRTLAKRKRDPSARYFTYTLLLRDGNVYVGSTDNVYVRLLDHYLMTSSSSVWVREHGPVQRVLEIVEDSTADDEKYKTLEYMSTFGGERVRGAGWCRSQMRAAPAALDAFARDRADFAYMSRPRISDVVTEVTRLAATLRADDTDTDTDSDDEAPCSAETTATAPAPATVTAPAPTVTAEPSATRTRFVRTH